MSGYVRANTPPIGRQQLLAQRRRTVVMLQHPLAACPANEGDKITDKINARLKK
jgi:hypothetical protein